MLRSSNPALARNDDLFEEYYGDGSVQRSNQMTLQGVVNKTGILLAMALVAGAGGYALVGMYPGMMWIAWITSLVVALGVFFIIYGKPQLSPVLGPVYAVVEGAFLGAFTGMIESMLVSQQIAVPGGVALQAFIITMSVLVAMLALYSAKIIKPTQTFKAVITTATVGIMFMYLISFVLGFFGIALPFVNIGSAFAGGMTAWIGLGINVLILGVASMWLVIDFKMIEDHVQAGSPKYMEWYGGFALIVSLAWIYYESVKLVARVAAIANRD